MRHWPQPSSSIERFAWSRRRRWETRKRNEKENGVNYTDDFGTRLQESAWEWQKLQLGALGFVGLCGVLRGDAGSARPLWLQDLSGIAALAGLVLAVLAVTMLATVAHPLTTRPMSMPAVSHRLSGAIVITFVAVGLTALSALSMWWPDGEPKRPAAPSNQMTVTTSSGSACGTVLDSGSGTLDLEVDGKRVSVPLNRLVSISVVDNC
jgi:hypothetical protein